MTAMMATACEREQRANARAERLRRDLARCWADHLDWNHLATSTNRLLSIETQLHNRPPDDHVAYQNLTTSHVRAEAAKARVTGVQSLLSLARQDAGKTSAEVRRLSHIVQGLSTDGFSAYLARATPADRRTVLDLNDAAQQRGQQRAGRPGASSDDPRAERKARRAKRARERRARAKAERVQPSEAVSLPARTGEEATTISASSTLTVTAMAPLHPQVRHHLRRMQAMAPDDRVVYQRFLDWSRDRGWAAVIVDAQERARHPRRLYRAPHAVIPLGPSAR